MARALTGDEGLIGSSLDLSDAKVLDFWRWAYSNLKTNDVRGVLAEWLVAKIIADVRDESDGGGGPGRSCDYRKP